MGMVLSIYSQKGFREVTLPERGQTGVEVLLQKELFATSKDIELDLEKEAEGWTLKAPDARISVGGNDVDSARIEDGLKLGLDAYGDRITVICFEQADPFCAYYKYSVSGSRQIRIGRDADNDMRYENSFVSGHHCVIDFDNGRAILRDESKNGTYLNYRRVYGSSVLKYGDSIRIMRLNIIYLGDMLAVDSCDDLSVTLRKMDNEEIERPRELQAKYSFTARPGTCAD